MTLKTFDLFVIGGGINGCGIARDAAGRGLSVCLAEMGDLASATSSNSTKLIHGGLRYLEHYEFKLVRKALREREVLWRIAPHIVRPLRFTLPHHPGLRPAWLIRLGLFLYDHLGGRELLPGTRKVDMMRDDVGAPLQTIFKEGFEYSDCWVDDARLVVLNAVDAAERGAQILVRTKVISARREDGLWLISTQNVDGTEQSFRAKILVNAAGPWVDEVLTQAVAKNDASKVRLVRGSHIVVPKMFDHDGCYIFQNSDGRILFAIPYEDSFTLVGTTDVDHIGDSNDIRISDDEVDYLCRSVSAYFKQPLERSDIVWTYSAVRPLIDDGKAQAQAATRDYHIQADAGPGQAPLINVFGGKITTYRRLAEEVMTVLAALEVPVGSTWTATASLPGGEFEVGEFSSQLKQIEDDYSFLTPRHAHRLLRQYGTRARVILGDATAYADLGQCFGSDLYEAEVRYQVEREWVMQADDAIWRRTKEGLNLSPADKERLEEFLVNHRMPREQAARAGG